MGEVTLSSVQLYFTKLLKQFRCGFLHDPNPLERVIIPKNKSEVLIKPAP